MSSAITPLFQQLQEAARQGGDMQAFMQSDAFLGFNAHKVRRTAAIRQALRGQLPTRLLLGSKLGCASAEVAGLTTETLPADFLAVQDEADLARKQAQLHRAVVVLNNNDIWPYRAQYAQLYDRCDETVFVAWDWDNHHWLDLSTLLAGLSDLYAPAHHENLFLLTRFNWATLGPVYCATVQWPLAFIDAHRAQMLSTERSDAPLGMHARYGQFLYRNRIVARLSHHYPTVGFSDPAFHARTPLDRLAEWYGHKLHWIVPVLNDVPIRIFDALITGGIPLIPACQRYLPLVKDLPRDMVLFYEPEDVLTPQPLVERGNRLFDAAGSAGIEARHRYAMAHHHLDQRLAQMVDAVREYLA